MISRSRKQQLLLQQVQSLLPEPLSGHCVGVVKNASRLLLYADSSAWAGRIRFITSELGVKLRECGLKVDRISVRVLLNNPPPKHIKSHRLRQLSADNASLITETAETIGDPELSAAMKRLARHHN